MSDYGEPWAYVEAICRDDYDIPEIADVPGVVMVKANTGGYGVENAEDRTRRIVACVNAMQGLDPSKLKGLLKAVRSVCSVGIESLHPDQLNDLFREYRALNGDA